MRKAKSSFLLGGFLLILSLFPGALLMRGEFLEEGEFAVHLIMTTGDIYIEAAVLNNEFFSLHLLDYASGLRVVEEASLENVTPIFVIEDVDNFSGIINLPMAAPYLLIVVPSIINASRMEYQISIWRATPHPRILILGMVIIVTGLYFSRIQLLSILNMIRMKAQN